MAGPTRDVALAIEALLDRKARIKLPDGVYMSFFNTSFEGAKIGFIDPALWRFPPDF
jgi:amidase